MKKILNNKLIKVGSWYTLSNFFVKGIVFLTIPIFTRLLSTEDYGVVSIYNTWVEMFKIFITLDLVVSVGRGKLDFKDDYNKFISSVLFLSIIIFFGFFLFFIGFEDFFIQLTNLTTPLFYLMVFQAYFSFVKQFALSKFKFEYKYKLVSFINIIFSVLNVIIAIILIKTVFVEERYYGRIFANWSLIIILGLFLLFYLLYKGKSYINLKYWKYSLSLSIPLILHNIAGIANSQFDRIIINKYLGESVTGIYSFSYNLAIVIVVLLVSFNEAWTPWLYEQLNKNNHNLIRKNAVYYRDVFTFLYMVILFLSPELVKVMANKEYWDGLYILPWILSAYYFQFMYTLEVNIEFYHKKTAYISAGTIITAVINICLNIIFVPIYGYMAAAITTVLSYLLLFIFHYILTSKIIKKSIFGLKFHLKSILYLICITLSYYVLQESLLLRLMFIIVIFIIFYRITTVKINNTKLEQN